MSTYKLSGNNIAMNSLYFTPSELRSVIDEIAHTLSIYMIVTASVHPMNQAS